MYPLCFSVYMFVFFISLFLHLSFSLLSIPLHIPSYSIFFVSLFLQLSFSFLSIPFHIPFYFYFRFGSIFVYLTICWLFFMNRYCMQRRWKKTLKLPSFLTPKASIFISFLSQTSLFSLFLCLQVHFLCFSIFHFRSSSYSVLPLFSFWFHFCLSHCMLIVFYESILQAEKVEEDTKATIFNSKKLGFLSHFYLKQVCFLCFSVYRFIFFVSLFLHLSFSFLSIPLHILFYFYFRFGSIYVYLTACSLFFMNRYCMQRRWKKALKLSFLTPKSFDF